MSAVAPQNPKNPAKFIHMLLNGANAGQLAGRLLQIAGTLANARIYARYLLELLKRRDVQEKIFEYTLYAVVVGGCIALLVNPVGLAGFGAGGIVAGERRVLNYDKDTR
ncbi:hypothetical protein CYLTODRAFT_163803 [Cylindrobasidium torrendii FP15055 ss-10]|uniref:Uncharacterized protein n=1 Tax=Cylindrobasidium torrendii FP15055 ss-10 TaxID=1314674 RepID=A0A0D7AX63_9AGAR|nr:hypothetical protein CYLTODRAFT_163803 [Cylindrobasidium torrendii FP15055 ss-10]